MKFLISPAVRLLAAIRYPLKLSLIALLFTVPLALVIGLWWQSVAAQIEITRNELIGTEFMPPLADAAKNLQLHRGLSQLVLAGDPAASGKLAEATAKVNQGLQELTRLARANPGYESVERSLEQLSGTWSALAATLESDRKLNFEKHSALIQQLLNVQLDIADLSTLALDPENETYYLMNLSVITMPQLTETVAEARGRLAREAVSQLPVDIGQISMIASANVQLGQLIRRAEAAITKIGATDGSVSQPLSSKLGELAGVSQSLEQFYQQLVATQSIGSPAATVFERMTPAVNLGHEIQAMAHEHLVEMLGERQDRISTQRNLMLTVLGLSLGLLTLVFAGFIQLLNGTLDNLRQQLQRFVGGDYDIETRNDTRDEFQLIANDLESVRLVLAKSQHLSIENARVRSALDNVTANVMIADRDFNIAYCNAAVMEMFRKAEADIRTELPQFRTDDILGGSIDRFHKNPAHQRGMLEKLASTYRAQILLGGRTLTVVANPIINAAGERLGAVVEWQDITAQLAEERKAATLAAENARVRSALDNCSTNVMIADNERTIVYMNKTVTAMLHNAEADLRKALPQFDVNKLMGGSIDSFHQNPEHQKRLLASLTSTYRTQIVVGGRTFSLVANPVLSDSGERLGSVVEWNDRTVEVAVEHEVAELVQAAAAGNFSQRIAEQGKAGFFLNLASGLNQLMGTAEKGLNDVVRMLGALSQGDLTQRITDDYEGTFGQLKDFSNETAGSLSRMLGQIREAADTIYTAANEISAGNTDLSSRTEEQASSLEETASSMEELTSTVKLNADNARQANSLAVNASEVAVDGGSVVEQVVRTMSSINESARKIADIIGVIDGIAFQTNILALNAAVEAARAGEQGRGFAVVAGEVRTLAQRSAAAAKEIKALISDSVEKVDNGNQLVAQAGKTMSEIVVAIKRVTDIMAEIAAASAEQSTGIEEVSGAVSQMDEMTQQNAALVEEAAASAESLLEQASVLSQSVAVFKFEHASAPAPARPAARLALARPAPASRSERAQPRALPRAAKPQDDEWEEF